MNFLSANDFGAFDAYAEFTDLAALKAASARPLRKSFRVNTLKSSVADIEQYGRGKDWELEPVSWCPEGFFIDREDREQALGRDLLHLLGHIYMQEAASMLPVALLDPQPGETVLDMSAAPGSKTTQIAARMRNTGVVVANDVQEKRLWTLKTALYRSGVVNTIVTKKPGQWFGKHMTERFDRVLCDAPCTAQGTVRKDPTALQYTSEHSIAKAASLQRDLLEAAVHACRVGGRIVYSTCTLTPEENELVVGFLLNKYCDQLEVVNVGMKNEELRMKNAIEDSQRVQTWLRDHSSFSILHSSLYRLWPQAYDTEGFFCAVLKKTAVTKEPKPMDTVDFQERPLRLRDQEARVRSIKDIYGTTFLEPGEQLFEHQDQLLVAAEAVATCRLPAADYALGLPYAKGLADHRLRLTHELAIARGQQAASNVLRVDPVQLKDLLAGKDVACPAELTGDVLLLWNDICIGRGLAKNGQLKNRLSRWMIQNA